MNCVKCGTALEGGARFCGACGSQQPGAVIPQAAVRTGQKTVFQGGGGAKAPQVQKPAEDLGTASTIAPPPSGQRPAATPTPTSTPTAKPTPTAAPTAKPAAATPAPTPAPSPSASKSTGSPSGQRRLLSQIMPAKKAEDDGDLRGKTLNNRYVVADKLGEGGFGSVWRARQTGMDREVALKVLHPRMAKDPQVVGRFKREAQASSLLRAPHTVQVYDFDQTPEGLMYLAMEMLSGRSLHAILQIDGPVEPKRMMKIMDGIAESLGEAHTQGIVHRDIKPENIYLEPRPTPDFVKVLDFGIAKIVSGDGLKGPQLTAAGQTLGTLEYMSPEQLMGQQLDGRSDLYALGIMAYEMMTGRLPFDAKTPTEMITGHLKTVPPVPSKHQPAISPELDAVIMKLLEKNRDKRFKDTAELRAALEPLINERPGAAAVSPAPPAQAQRFDEPSSTDKVRLPGADGEPKSKLPMLLLVGAVAVALLAGIIALVYLSRHG
jgi:tRNA A-37 threonylcarbamoyl transferase component Bud32